jgi:adenosylhomocysteine nucleosidase
MAMKKILAVLLFCFISLSATAQRIAVLGALDEEIALLLEAMTHQKKVTKGGIDFYKGKLSNKKVVILKAGVGKVNAAYSTAVLTQNFKISTLIFTGVAGGLHPDALPGDLVIGEYLIQYDYGKVDSLGFFIAPFRKLTGGSHDDIYIAADKDLFDIGLKSAVQLEFKPVANRLPRVFSGVIATGNEKAAWLYNEFNALATEMEGAAVAHICRTLDIPFLVIRSCSDNANNQARLSFNQFVGPASVNSSTLVIAILKAMK